MKKIELILWAIFITVFLIFKASIFFVLSGLILAAFYMLSAFRILLDAKAVQAANSGADKSLLRVTILSGLAPAICIMAMIFKIQHWPGASMQALFAFVVHVPLIVFSLNKQFRDTYPIVFKIIIIRSIILLALLAVITLFYVS
jgi:hypothetical protein